MEKIIDTGVSPQNAKVASQVSDKLNAEEVTKLLEAMEILNVADEEEPQGLFKVGDVEVLSRQTVNIIAAQKKSGKTNFSALLMAACAAKDRQVLSGFIRCMQDSVKVLVIDTEQPYKDARRTLRRAMKTSGYDYDEQWSEHGINVLSFKDVDCLDEVVVQQDATSSSIPDLNSTTYFSS